MALTKHPTHPRQDWSHIGTVALFLILAGCSEGQMGGDGLGNTGASVGAGATPGTGSGAGTGSGGDVTGGGGSGSTTPTMLLARTWRLSHEQYRKSVLDLVGVEPDLSNFKPESGNGKFTNFSSTAFVRVDLADNYFDNAIEIAETLPAGQLSTLTSCALQNTCIDSFIAELGERAFRSPVPSETAASLKSIFDETSAEVDTETGFRAVLASLLNSPLFLYRKEIGESTDTTSAQFELTNYQIAEFLSYSLLDGPPPDWLLERAREGEFSQSQLGALIEEIMEEPAFEEQLREFLMQWMEVDHFETVEKMPESFPGFGLVRSQMEEELHAFFEQSGTPENTLHDLLLDPVPSVSQSLDDFYYSDPSAPEEAERLGVLGLGAVLASHAKTYLTSPTLRGTFIRKRFFCQEITLPDQFTPPPISETEALKSASSTRELYEQHLVMPSCSPCHRLTDNIGFALEAFDGAGRFRTEDSTQGPPVPLDLETEITDSDVDRPLFGASDLSEALAESQQVKACLTRQAFRFFFGQAESEDEPDPLAIADGAGLGDTLTSLAAGVLTTSDTMNRSRQETN